MNADTPLHLFQAVGIELEYMIVACDTLDVLPVADKVLRAAAASKPQPDRPILPPAFSEPGTRDPDPEAAAEYPSEVEMGDLCWSNELVLHVIELKANGPATSLDPLPATFHRDVTRINSLLVPMGGRLMPSAAHPWMNPDRDTRLWPHDYGEVYRAFDKVFGCRGHGWSNLQSMHINLPFANDAEFARLHAAVRLVLPIIPALAAGSPIIEGRVTGLLDNRLAFYRTNCRRIPSVTGSVIPEPVFTRRDYEEQILQRIYRDVAPYDPDAILRDEWVNARGAIARFCRNTIEIRVVDMQECPSADLAVAGAIVAVLKAMVAERWIDLARQQAWGVEPLDSILQATTKDAESAIISDRAYLDAFCFPRAKRCTAGELWHHLVETLGASPPVGASAPFPQGGAQGWNSASVSPSANEAAPKEAARSAINILAPLRTILDKGTLARRIIKASTNHPSPEQITAVYRDLCRCLAEDRAFA